MTESLKMFISYSHVDEHALARLRKHLSMLKRNEVLSAWYDQKISAGGDIDEDVSSHLEECDIFLALVSADFLASNYCYEREMRRAIERHDEGSLRVIPVIVQPCDWQTSPLGKLKALPKDGKAVSEWTNENNAWLDVVTQIRGAIMDIAVPRLDTGRPSAKSGRNSKYRVKRDFDEVDKQDYRDQAFAEFRRYFELASREIGDVEGIRAKFSSMGGDAFTCTVVNACKRAGECAHYTLLEKWPVIIWRYYLLVRGKGGARYRERLVSNRG